MAISLVKGYKARITSPITGVRWQQARINTNRQIFDVSGTKDSSRSVTPMLISGLPTIDVTLAGVAKHSTTATETYGRGYNTDIKQYDGSTALASPHIKPYEWTLRRVWNLEDVTGAGDPTADAAAGARSRSFMWSTPITYLTMSAWLKTASSSPKHWLASPMGFNASLDNVGTLKVNTTGLGGAIIRSTPTSFDTRNGFVNMQIDAVLSGLIDYTGGNSDYADIFEDTANTVKVPPRGATTIDFETDDSGETLGGTAIVYDVTLRGSRKQDALIRVEARHRYDSLAS